MDGFKVNENKRNLKTVKPNDARNVKKKAL